MNTLFTIIFVACLTPTDCKTVSQPAYLQSQLPLSQWMEAQQIVAKWQADHPARVVKGGFRLVRGKETDA